MSKLTPIMTCAGEVQMDTSHEACARWNVMSGALVSHPLGWVAHVVGVGIGPNETEEVLWVRNCLTGEVFSPISPMLMEKSNCCSRSAF
jgi:hypothetical protein